MMTLKEVAEYLHVSEETVRIWVEKGQLACDRSQPEWQFERTAVEQWVKRHSVGTQTRIPGSGVDIHAFLTPERIVELDCATKQEALVILTGLLAQVESMPSADELLHALTQREELMSTGIGLGVGVPHVRLPDVEELTIALGIHRKGLTDYESLDGRPIHLICAVVAPSSQHTEYVRILANICAHVKQHDFFEALWKTKSQNEILDLLA